MFDCFHAIWHKRMDFSVNRSRVEYMVRCIWISMQVHMIIDEFTQNGIWLILFCMQFVLHSDLLFLQCSAVLCPAELFVIE